MTLLHFARSKTPIADEYAFVSRTMMRCERQVTTFDRESYAPAAIEKVRDMWLRRMESEHRSASVFAVMCNQLMEAGATIDMAGIALRMAQDELRHGEVCAEVVVALGGEAVREVSAVTAPVAVHAGCSAEERALRNVIYGCCLTETVNSARFVDALESTTDPFLRDVTRQLLSDETLHAQFGFHYLTAWQAWLDAHDEARRSISRYLHFAFAVLERDLSGRSMSSVEPSAEELALGLPSARRTREIFYVTVEGAVLPALDRFGLDATAAWKARSMDPPAPAPIA